MGHLIAGFRREKYCLIALHNKNIETLRNLFILPTLHRTKPVQFSCYPTSAIRNTLMFPMNDQFATFFQTLQPANSQFASLFQNFGPANEQFLGTAKANAEKQLA